MNKYYIKELQSEYTYLDVRILTYLECEDKMRKITEILNFLRQNNFLINLTQVYYKNNQSEKIVETREVPSLTIDFKDNKFRFKYWNGAMLYWVYHTQDLFTILINGRKDFDELIKKYKSVNDVLLNNKDGDIHQIRYKYYPQPDVDILYELEFKKHVKDKHLEDVILKKLYDKINNLNLKDLRMEIGYSYQQECLPCQKAKERRENERKTMDR